MPTARRGPGAAPEGGRTGADDVGMTAIKVASFGEGVNVTLGLPFPRTSPDHGTALDIAGRGVASADAMVAAILTAVAIAERITGRVTGG